MTYLLRCHIHPDIGNHGTSVAEAKNHQKRDDCAQCGVWIHYWKKGRQYQIDAQCLRHIT